MKRHWGRILILWMTAARLILLSSGPAHAQISTLEAPASALRAPIEITVLFPAGSSADVTARLLAEGMAKRLGVQVIVVNRPGAGGALGYRHVAAQKPDGSSLVWNSNSISTTYHSGQLAFDYKAFDAIARVLAESPLLVVRGDAKWKTLTDFVIDTRAQRGKITVANSGVGSHTHISAVALFHAAGVEVTEVPYAAAQVVPSLMGGHVDAMVQLPGALAAQVKSGALRILSTITAVRDPAFPNVPTAREQGVEVALDAWRGVAAPRGMPKALTELLEKAIRETTESAVFAQAAERLGVRPWFAGAQEFGEQIAREDGETARLMAAIGLKK